MPAVASVFLASRSRGAGPENRAHPSRFGGFVATTNERHGGVVASLFKRAELAPSLVIVKLEDGSVRVAANGCKIEGGRQVFLVVRSGSRYIHQFRCVPPERRFRV